jgi:hypothetical protein
MKSDNKSLRPFGLRFLEIPPAQLDEANGGCKKPQSPAITQAISMPTTKGGSPDRF